MESQVVVVGAGPAGALLSYLLSSRGIETTLIERQTDFAREFRGEVLMPSGIRALHDAGFSLSELSTSLPSSIEGYLNGRRFLSLDGNDFDEIRPTAVSQPELLEHLVSAAEKTGHFQLRRGHTVRGLKQNGDREIVLRIATAGSDHEESLTCGFVVGADGRNSVIRRRLGVPVREKENPLDVVWFKMPYPGDWHESKARFAIGKGHLLIALRSPGGLLQVAWVILKGAFGDLRSRGIEGWIEAMADHADPELAAHLKQSADRVSQPFLLNVVTDRVLGWSSPTSLLIGDAAHTMSPVGGQGLNLALRDAIVAANTLVPAFQKGADVGQAAAQVEILRGPEIDQIQRLAAIPPRIIMGRSLVHDAARQAIARLANTQFGRSRAGSVMSVFLNGTTKVELKV